MSTKKLRSNKCAFRGAINVPSDVDKFLFEFKILLTHIPQVRTQNVVFLKYEFFRITNQSTIYRSLRHSDRD